MTKKYKRHNRRWVRALLKAVILGHVEPDAVEYLVIY